MSAALALGLLLAAAPLPDHVRAAVDEALAVPGARVVPVSYEGGRCAGTRAALPRPIQGSGRYAVKLEGRCNGWAWLRVEVWAPVAVTTRAVREGEPLAGAVTTVERQVQAGRPPAVLAEGAVAARAIPRGQVVAPESVRSAGAGAGDAVKVLVRSGPIAIEATGRLVACGRGRACAVLPTGRHLEGRLEEGRLIVEVP